MAECLFIAGDVEICFDSFGDEGDPAMLLVMGLGTQMLWWRDEFCEEIASRGYHVIRYDNRDVGRSSRLHHVPSPTPWQLLRRTAGIGGYTLSDMAADGMALLDHLGIHAAHVVGASMGGMIAQVMAGNHRERVLSLVSIMSNTGSWRSGQPSLRMYPRLIRKMPAERERYVEQAMRNWRETASPGFPRDAGEYRRLLEQAFDRAHGPAGVARQLAAIVASGDRTSMLKTIDVPTLVIHGTADRLVAPSGGRATAAAIRGAHLMMIEGMGHDMPRAVWPQIVSGIVQNAERVSEQDEARGRPREVEAA
ncbi:MAG: alpha/beta fold hydrolase [Actinomycetota bacterium]|nr:alpha/beta fold hydrolase [Actinomycetota bacterium]